MNVAEEEYDVAATSESRPTLVVTDFAVFKRYSQLAAEFYFATSKSDKRVPYVATVAAVNYLPS